MTSSLRLRGFVLGMVLLASSSMADQLAVDRSCRQAAQARPNKPTRMVTWPLGSALSHVSCTNRVLAIYADNAKLTEILDRVAKCTGATVDVPAKADDLISGRLGPAPALQVLRDLLGRTRYDFYIASATGHASDICFVKLMPRSSTPSSPARVLAPQTASVANRAAQIANLTGGDEGVGDEVDVGTPVTGSASSVAGAAPLPARPRAPARGDSQ